MTFNTVPGGVINTWTDMCRYPQALVQDVDGDHAVVCFGVPPGQNLMDGPENVGLFYMDGELAFTFVPMGITDLEPFPCYLVPVDQQFILTQQYQPGTESSKH